MESTQAPQLLTVKQAALVANASASYIRKAINAGALPYVDLSLGDDPERRELRIAREDLDAYLLARKRQMPRAPQAAEKAGKRGR
jgi:excisionase family DNA binding protein